jgi:ATP-dependent Clp protease ATP-binding subunit ClpB
VYVDEPTIENTISILRGIKDKYETHHGIKIADDAIIAAVNLSVRYINDRFLPDKAIDLIDEAAAAAKIEIDSMPIILDEIKRKLTQIDIELAALKREKDVEERKKTLEETKKLQKQEFESLHAKWSEQKKIIAELQKNRIKLDQLKIELENAERDVLLDKAAELKYSQIPEIEKKIKETEEQWKKIPVDDRLLKEQVTDEDIAQIVSRWTGIPVTKLLATESNKLAHLEKELQEHVVGQNHALEKVARAIRRNRAGLSDVNKPIGSFLFLGPTGVGKTETAKALAEVLFNDAKAMIRIDMSEYQEAHTVARLIGAPPGYVGYEEGGQLTEAVRHKPYSVILFDEVEKAHPQVFNIFLQILDDGMLTDSRGRNVNFKNTIIILTSNLGSDLMTENAKQSDVEFKIMDRVRSFFKPEFINRLDSIVIFNPLSNEMLKQIVDIQLKEVKERLAKQNLDIDFTDNIKKHLMVIGYDSVYGARPLKRLINEVIIDEIALQLIEGKIKLNDYISVDYKNEEVVITSKSG